MKGVRQTSNRERRRRGMLTLEWILVITLLVVGIIGGLSAIRNTIVCEFSGVARCIGTVDITRCLEGPPNCPLPSSAPGVTAWWCSTCNQPPQP